MRLYVHQLRADQLIFWRGRESAVFVFLFPILLFLLLGTVYGGEFRGRPVTDYLMPSLIAYGVANTMFGGLAITLVIRRESGILKRIRSTPLPGATYLAATVTSSLFVFTLQALVIMLLGAGLYNSDVPSDLTSLLLTYALGAICFAGVGLGVASLIRSSEGASAVVNVIVLPMTFLSGGFGPTRDFPEFLKAIADVLPLTYLVDLITGIVYEDKGIWDQPRAVAVLTAWGIAGALVAWRRFSWEPRER
ncbi:MAG TPA: ABC transporter permease [Gaiellaceae bacterium]|nr:ABC transporter permease [Gaiellaceae bacterium]